MHAVVSLANLKQISAAKNLGGISAALTACITAAYFEADPSRTRAVVGQNVLFEPDAPAGNHVCVKMVTLHRRAQEDKTLCGAARSINARGQALADLVVGSVTKRYVQGSLSQAATSLIERRHSAMDFLVSNLPAFETASPAVVDLQTCREFCDWAPSIVYVIGVEDNLFCDFYWGARPTFNETVFRTAFASITNAVAVHTKLPACY